MEESACGEEIRLRNGLFILLSSVYAPRSVDPLLLMIPYSALNEDRKQGNKGERRLGRANVLKIASPPSSLSDIPRGE